MARAWGSPRGDEGGGARGELVLCGDDGAVPLTGCDFTADSPQSSCMRRAVGSTPSVQNAALMALLMAFFASVKL